MRRIDFVAPPFAGHLFPAIELAGGLSERGVAQVRILSTAGARSAASAANLEFREILLGRDQDVWAIANTRHRVGSHPWQLWQQVQRNLALMRELQNQLREEWQRSPPDLVITDFVVPVAGLTAQQLNVPWWTGMPTPCALETRDGVPSYLGGWMPCDSWSGRQRDRLGWLAIHSFKRLSALLFARSLRELGLRALYRPDGSEALYSPERILAYGMQEFEFPRTWPSQLEFIGPLTKSPFQAKAAAADIPDRSVLITLGTHLPWAKERAVAMFRRVAAQLPDITFCFSRGMPGSTRCEIDGNFQLHDDIPYNSTLHRFTAAVIHGGTGITYSCLQAGVPMLVWPQDYDQFDHAARICHHGLGKRLCPSPAEIVADLRWLLSQPSRIQKSLKKFRELLHGYEPIGAVAKHCHHLEEARSLSKMSGSRRF